MYKKFAGAQRSMVGVASMFVSPDMSIQEPEFAVFDQRIGILEIGATRPDGFNLRPGEHHSGFQLVFQKIIMTCGPVLRGIPLPGGDGIALQVPGLIRFGLVNCMTGHDCTTGKLPATFSKIFMLAHANLTGNSVLSRS